MLAPVHVSPTDVKVAGDTVTINNKSFSDHLAASPVDAHALVAAVAPSVKASDLTVNPDGSVAIHNAQLAATLQTHLNPGLAKAAAGNVVCGVGCRKPMFNAGVRVED